MKTIRPYFLDCEVAQLEEEAGRIGISVKDLVHDRAMKMVPEDAPLSSAKILADEISECRAVFNEIARREMGVKTRLYEDDIIRMEMALNNIEAMVAAYITQVLAEVKDDGKSEV